MSLIHVTDKVSLRYGLKISVLLLHGHLPYLLILDTNLLHNHAYNDQIGAYCTTAGHEHLMYRVILALVAMLGS